MTLRLRFVPVLLVAAAFAASATSASAQTIEFLARLDQAQEVPPTGSPAVGIGVVAVDTVANVLSYRVTYVGLTAPENAAHIHGFSGPGVSSGVLNAIPLGAFKCGSWAYAPAQEANILAGLTYFNVHTTAFGAGEIRGQISESPIHGTFCFGDGSSIACPCGNNSATADLEGCLHSGGQGGRLRAYGSASVASDQVVMHALRLPPNTQGLLFQGTGPQAAAPFGDGLRCAGGNVQRLGTKTACNGQIAWPEAGQLPLSVLGGIVPPTVTVYQVWYRNAAVFCTAATFNLTNAVRVAWMP